MVAKTRPRNASGTWRSSCPMFITELKPTPARESAIKTNAQGKLRVWLNSTYEPAVHDIAGHHRALVVIEAQPPADAIGQRPAAQQAHAPRSPR